MQKQKTENRKPETMGKWLINSNNDKKTCASIANVPGVLPFFSDLVYESAAEKSGRENFEKGRGGSENQKFFFWKSPFCNVLAAGNGAARG